MSTETVLEFDRLPPLGPAYLRAVTTLGGGLPEGGAMPSIAGCVDGLQVDDRAVERYNGVCGFNNGDTLPITYPHALAFPVHMAVLSRREFPFKLMGLVHVRNSITQRRAIGIDDELALRVSVGSHRQVHNGIEFDLETAVYDTHDECLWESTSTMLSRGGGSGQRSGSRKKPSEDLPEDGQTEQWDVPADIGRRYARAAGDVNPIHLSTLSAKLFGFPRAIAHGMWLKARAAALMMHAVESERYSISVAFKKPVLLPAKAALTYRSTQAGVDFALQNERGDVTHMVGEIASS